MGVVILRRTFALCAALACGLAISHPALAQPVDESPGQAANAGSEEVVKQATELNDIGEKLYEQGDYEGALPLYVEALRLHRQALGERHPDTITMASNYAVALSSAGRLEEAEPLLAEVLRLNREVLGETQVEGLIELTLAEITIRAVTKVRPGTHQIIENEFRRLLQQVLAQQAASGTMLKVA